MIHSGLLRLFKSGSFVSDHIINWDELLAEAEAHQVTELVASLARHAGHCTGLVGFEQAYRRNLARNLAIIAEMEDILARLNRAGVRCMILKGVLLAERLYADPGARRSGDIDLLVEAHELDRALEIMTGAGYTRTNDEALERAGLGDYVYNIKLDKATPHSFFYIELHNHFTSRRGKYIDMSEVWARSRQVAFGKTVVYDLSPLDLLIFLSMHSAYHGFETLRHVLDIARLLEVEGDLIDWPGFISLVKQYRTTARAFSALYYAVILLAAPVPGWVLDELLPPPFLHRRLLRECLLDRLPTGLSPVTWGLVNNETLPEFFLNAWHILFPPAAKIKLLYAPRNPALTWCYYPVHWLAHCKIFFKTMR